MRLLQIFLLMVILGSANVVAQNELVLPAHNLLQYEAAKARGKAAGRLFKKAGFERIQAHDVLRGRESCILWGLDVKANLEYDGTRQPLYRLFRKTRLSAMGLIDHIGGVGQPVELVFWDKRIYRAYAAELAGLGFVKSITRNTISFRNPSFTIGVDIDIWPDIYVMRVLEL